MKGFYLLLVGVAVIGGGVLWYGSQRTPAAAPSGPVPVAAADGFREFARSLGLDLDKYDACMDGQRYAGRIQASVQEGEARGVKGTPSFYVNGRPYQGRSASDDFKALVDSLTKKHK